MLFWGVLGTFSVGRTGCLGKGNGKNPSQAIRLSLAPAASGATVRESEGCLGVICFMMGCVFDVFNDFLWLLMLFLFLRKN